MEPETPDALLIAAYLAGEEAALECLFGRYRAELYGYLLRMTGHDRMTADDLFQELWIKILRALPKFRDPENFRPWAYRIAHNEAIRCFRSRCSRDRIGHLSEDGELPEPSGAESPSPEQPLEERERAAMLDEAIGTLPEDQREVLLLRREGVSFQKIAEIQDCSVNTALGRMHYAVNRLKKYFQEKGEIQ